MKIGLLSLGCPKNLVDSEVMLGLARHAGHDVTHDAAEADVLVVNTCAFIDRARQESIDAILEMVEQKRTGRCQRLIVTGCLAERYRDDLRTEIPEIDVLLGTAEVPEILRAITGEPCAGPIADRPSCSAQAGAPVALYRRNGDRLDGPAAPDRRLAAGDREVAGERVRPTYLYDASTPRLLTTPRHLAYVKIAEGCDYNCAFCIIPTLRGPYRSRPAASIVEEARRLVAGGVREILLVSQDTTFYGIDRRDRRALPDLLRALSAINGLAWIRLLYLYPTTITDEMLDAMAESEKICKYIDLPLQHSARSVLRRMRRPGNRQDYERLLRRIRERLPGVTLRTTFIVGFPGETPAEFADLEDFLRTVEFEHVGVFTYSHEEGTAAYSLPDDLPGARKARRRRRLMTHQRRIVERRHRSLVGARVRLMVDGPAPEHQLVLQGRLEGQAPEIDPVVYLSECDSTAFAPGSLVEVEIIGARGYDLLARPLAARAALC